MKERTSNARLFIGVRISLATVNALNEAMPELEARAQAANLTVRWTAPASYHVTLKFIGWARVEVIDAIRDRVAEHLRGVGAFSFATRGAGAFPNVSKARVLWAGVDDSAGGLAELARRVETATVELGFAAEKRDHHPHVTLARLSEPSGVESVLEPLSEQLFSETFVESVILYESTVKSKGSEYIVRHEWSLERASRGSKRQSD